MKRAFLLPVVAAAAVLCACQKPEGAPAKTSPPSAVEAKAGKVPASSPESSRAIEAALSAVRAAGFPGTAEELNAAYAEPPPEQNAAPVFTQAIRRIVQAPTNAANLPLVTSARVPLPAASEPLAPAVRQAVSAHLARNQAALALFRQAAGMRQCRFPVDLRQGAATPLPHLAGLRGGDRLLQLEAALHADNRNVPGAVASIEAILGIARALENEPALISHLVRIAQEGAAATALERLLCRQPMPEKQREALAIGFAAAEGRDDLARTVAAEIVIMGTDFDRNRKAAEGMAGRSLDPAEFFGAHTRLLAAGRAPYPQRLATFATGAGSARGLTSADMEALLRKDAKHHAHLRLVRAALTIEAFRSATRLPAPKTLAELPVDFLKAVPTDPFDGKPLRYKPQTRGYLIYSIGPDLSDDNGAVAAPFTGGELKPGDLVFTVSR